MLLLATEKVWHYWIAVPLAAMAILAVVGIIGGFVAMVVRTRYPKTDS